VWTERKSAGSISRIDAGQNSVHGSSVPVTRERKFRTSVAIAQAQLGLPRWLKIEDCRPPVLTLTLDCAADAALDRMPFGGLEMLVKYARWAALHPDASPEVCILAAAVEERRGLLREILAGCARANAEPLT
jgi:hypothetical protein